MIPEIGHFALILATLLSLVAATVPLVGAARRDEAMMAMAPNLAIGLCVFVLVAFLSLMWAYITSDFSVINVAQNSHTAKPLLYKISGVWGNHEGSLLLWVLVLCLFSAGIAAFARLEPEFKARVLAVQAMIAAGFLLFSVLTSNPFLRTSPAPLEGNGLNPVLQDPGLAFHPPFLYLGYVGFSVAFSFAVAGLIQNRIDADWAKQIKPWVLTAWSLLTIGIALGSWWAYYELGWGGFWFWDPVENASLMPWLVGTALLHSVKVVERREALKHWTVLLAIVTFALSLVGTFLVRSGVLTSVHAFANDPDRGLFILGFLTVAVGGALALYATRAGSLDVGKAFHPISREGSLVLNNFLLFVAMAVVFVGTLYPLFLDALTGAKISVGPPYYAATVVPIALGLMFVMALAPFMAWRQRANLARTFWSLRYAGAAALAAIIVTLWQASPESLMAVLGLGLATWLIVGTILYGVRAVESQPGASRLARLARLPRGRWGLLLAHGGIAVTAFGVTASGLFETSYEQTLPIGGEATIGDYTFHFESVREVQGPNYTAERGVFQVSEGGRQIATMTPETRFYDQPQTQTTEAAIRPRPTGDLYAVLGEPAESGAYAVRIYHKPFVSWIWGGALIMALGGALTISERQRAPQRRDATAGDPQPAGAAT